MNLRRFLDRLARWSDPITPSLNARHAHPGTLTIVSVVYSTEAKTFTGPAVYVTQVGAPVATSKSNKATPTPDPQPTESSAPTSTEQADSTESAAPSTTSDSQSTSSSSTSSSTPVASTTAAPLTSQPSTPTVGAISSTSASPTAATATARMSGGAKAGLAFGIILGLAFVGFGVFYLYRRQRQKHGAHQRLDDEKMAMTHPDVLPRHPEPEMTATAPPASQSAPHLSLRPVTQFNPNLPDNQQNAAPDGMPASASAPNLMAATATATAPATPKGTTGFRQPGASAWERPGSRNAANDPANPFGNHAETVNSRPGTAQAPPPVPAKTPTQPAVAPVAAPARAPSPQDINPADFPLPSSAPASPNAPNFDPNVTSQPTSPGSPSSTTAGAATGAATGAAAGAVAGAAVAGAASKSNSPKKQPPASKPVHRVQMDFIPSMDDELEIHTGQLLRIKHEYDDGWVS